MDYLVNTTLFYGLTFIGILILLYYKLWKKGVHYDRLKYKSKRTGVGVV